jgi:RNA ligase
MNVQIRKYPRTHHVEGSRLQPGDEDLTATPFSNLCGRHLVVEEKVDGANAAFSFDGEGKLLLQSRGHYLCGGARERHFALLKTWATRHQQEFYERIGSRYVVYGEWLYAKHTVFYDRLPHYFLEFDVLDREREEFLSTERRRELLLGLPVVAVPVLRAGAFDAKGELTRLLKESLYKSPDWYERLSDRARELGLDVERVRAETDPSRLAEGLYIKVEDGGVVRERYKYIRASFLTSVVDSGTHWLSRPIVPNLLAPGVDLYREAP